MKHKPIPVGSRYGKLTVTSEPNCVFDPKAKRNRYYYDCICDCGKSSKVRHDRIYQTTSCGCNAIKRGNQNNFYKHGSTKTRLYTIWACMKNRCYSPQHHAFKYYGGRGVTVCDEWKHDFSAFQNWAMANGYSEDLTIDRIDVNGNYCPENCRWVTLDEQNRNTRRNRSLTAFGETKLLCEWKDDNRTAVSMPGVVRRLSVGWDAETAITANRLPPKKTRSRWKTMTAFGETKLLKEWIQDERCEVNYTTLYNRVFKQNWRPEEALLLPKLR